mgnify:CR=1 FL=1
MCFKVHFKCEYEQYFLLAGWDPRQTFGQVHMYRELYGVSGVQFRQIQRPTRWPQHVHCFKPWTFWLPQVHPQTTRYYLRVVFPTSNIHINVCSHKSKFPCVNPLNGDWFYSCERSVFHSTTSEIIASVKWLNRFLWFIWYFIPSTWNDYICTFFFACDAFITITLVYCSNKQRCILR